MDYIEDKDRGGRAFSEHTIAMKPQTLEGPNAAASLRVQMPAHNGTFKATRGDIEEALAGPRRRLLYNNRGSFKVQDGPQYDANDQTIPVYSCIEACQLVFGDPVFGAQWYGSTSNLTVNNLCYGDQICSICMWVYINSTQHQNVHFLLDGRFYNVKYQDWPTDVTQFNTINREAYFSNSVAGQHWGALYVDGYTASIDWPSFPIDQWFHIYLEGASEAACLNDDLNLYARVTSGSQTDVNGAMKGRLAEVYAWSRHVPEREIVELARGYLCWPCYNFTMYTGLLFYYTLEDAEGHLVSDRRHPNDHLYWGQLFGDPWWVLDQPIWPGWHPFEEDLLSVTFWLKVDTYQPLQGVTPIYVMDARYGDPEGLFSTSTSGLLWERLFVDGVSMEVSFESLPIGVWTHLHFEAHHAFSDDLNFMSHVVEGDVDYHVGNLKGLLAEVYLWDRWVLNYELAQMLLGFDYQMLPLQ
eukprot:gene7687-9150_t